jgi:hypothetical protein
MMDTDDIEGKKIIARDGLGPWKRPCFSGRQVIVVAFTDRMVRLTG